MRPRPCLIMCGTAARAHTMAPRRFTSSVSWKSSSVRSSSGASLRTPALFTRTSRRPHSSTTRSNVRSTAKASVMSLVKGSASPPSRRDLLGGVGDPGRVAVEERHLRPRPGQHPRGRRADAAAGAGDDRHAAFERQDVRDLGHGPQTLVHSPSPRKEATCPPSPLSRSSRRPGRRPRRRGRRPQEVLRQGRGRRLPAPRRHPRARRGRPARRGEGRRLPEEGLRAEPGRGLPRPRRRHARGRGHEEGPGARGRSSTRRPATAAPPRAAPSSPAMLSSGQEIEKHLGRAAELNRTRLRRRASPPPAASSPPCTRTARRCPATTRRPPPSTTAAARAATPRAAAAWRRWCATAAASPRDPARAVALARKSCDAGPRRGLRRARHRAAEGRGRPRRPRAGARPLHEGLRRRRAARLPRPRRARARRRRRRHPRPRRAPPSSSGRPATGRSAPAATSSASSSGRGPGRARRPRPGHVASSGRPARTATRAAA